MDCCVNSGSPSAAPKHPLPEGGAPPLGVYIHLPWCIRKCPYCDFNSHPAPEQLPEGEYVNALIADLAAQATVAQGRRADSVFFGGGTPSLFGGAAIADVLAAIDRRLGLTGDCEITLEANPGASDARRFAAYRQAGVNRLSLGVQSFDDRALRALGRIHDSRAAHEAIGAVRDAGFTNFNLDLMHGLPGQTPAAALADIETALAWQPPHLSHYQLTIEPHTAFAATPPRLPAERQLAAIGRLTRRRLAGAGYRNYEISAWSLAGKEARHNLNYWRFGDYLGLGAGAHGKLTLDGIVWRYARQPHPKRYLEAARTARWNLDRRAVPAADLAFEYFMNTLRLAEGTTLADFTARTGQDIAAIAAPLARARELGLLRRHPQRLIPTARGYRYLNDLLALFLPPNPIVAGH